MNSIEEQVLRTIGEDLDNPDVFTDDKTGMALIRESINDAVQELCMILGAYTRDYHLPLIANRQWYRLDPQHDYIAYLIDAWDMARKKKLVQTDVQTISTNPYFLRDQGAPENYLFIGFNVFGVWPTPANEGDMLILKCVCMPKPYTEDYDVIYLRDYLQQAAANYAQSEYYASRGDAKKGQDEHKQYLEIAQLESLNRKSYERQWTSYTNKVSQDGIVSR